MSENFRGDLTHTVEWCFYPSDFTILDRALIGYYLFYFLFKLVFCFFHVHVLASIGLPVNF